MGSLCSGKSANPAQSEPVRTNKTNALPVSQSAVSTVASNPYNFIDPKSKEEQDKLPKFFQDESVKPDLI